MSFPITSDYVLAVLNPSRFILNSPLSGGRAELNQNGEPLIYSGGFARVFMFRTPNEERFAFRCWTADCGDSVTIYREASAHLTPLGLPHFAKFSLQDPGILAANNRWPTVTMEWVEGRTLKEFLAAHRHEPLRLAYIRQRFVAACRALHQHQISHGDLQPDNLKVRPAGKAPDGSDIPEEIVFLDYDTLCVPKLEGSPRVNAGLPAYQHPTRPNAGTARLHDDYFSELVLYISILALERRPSLWDHYRLDHRDKELIFNEVDYQYATKSPAMAEIESIDDELAALVHELRHQCAAGSIEYLEPLETILDRVARGKRPAARSLFQSVLKDGAKHTPIPATGTQPVFTPTAAQVEHKRAWPPGGLFNGGICAPPTQSVPPPLTPAPRPTTFEEALRGGNPSNAPVAPNSSASQAPHPLPLETFALLAFLAGLLSFFYPAFSHLLWAIFAGISATKLNNNKKQRGKGLLIAGTCCAGVSLLLYI